MRTKTDPAATHLSIVSADIRESVPLGRNENVMRKALIHGSTEQFEELKELFPKEVAPSPHSVTPNAGSLSLLSTGRQPR